MVYDLTYLPSCNERIASTFFNRSSNRISSLEVTNGTCHHITLSVVGAHPTSSLGYMRAKYAQELAVRRSSVPYTIARATQLFECAPAIANSVSETGRFACRQSPSARSLLTTSRPSSRVSPRPTHGTRQSSSSALKRCRTTRSSL